MQQNLPGLLYEQDSLVPDWYGTWLIITIIASDDGNPRHFGF